MPLLAKCSVLFLDRSHSHDFAKQFDDSYNKIQSYVKVLENEIEQRSKLVELLENGQTFYEVQNDDAMVVANVSICLDNQNIVLKILRLC